MANKQPSNKIARLELLIILDYLFKKTDENHLSRQSDIEQFAQEEYGVEIRRQRITDCLESLKEFCDEYSNNLSFALEDVSTGCRLKYYISKRPLNVDEISSIIKAIQNDKHIPSEETNSLINKFLISTTSESIKDELLSEHKDFDYESKNSMKTKNNRKSILKAIDDISYIEFKVSDIRLINSSSPISYSSIYDENYVFKGFPHSIKKFDNIEYVLFVIPSQRDLICLPLSALKILEITPVGEVESFDNAVNLYEGYKSIEEYLQENIIPFDGTPMDITFAFELTSSNLETIQNSFINTFGKDFTYECYQRRKVKTVKVIDGLNNQEEYVMVNYAKVNIKMQKNLFIEWISNPIIEKIIEVIKPYDLKRTLIASHINELYKLTADRPVLNKFLKEHLNRLSFLPTKRSSIKTTNFENALDSSVDKKAIIKNSSKAFLNCIDTFAYNLEQSYVDVNKQNKRVAELIFTRSVLSTLDIDIQQYKNNVRYYTLVEDIGKIKLDRKIDSYVDFNDYVSFAIELKAISPSLGSSYQARSTLINLYNLSNIKVTTKTFKKYLICLIKEKDNDLILNTSSSELKSHLKKYKSLLALAKSKKMTIYENDFKDINGTQLTIYKDNNSIGNFEPFTVKCIYKEKLNKSAHYLIVYEVL